jgi:hypothetical protein
MGQSLAPAPVFTWGYSFQLALQGRVNGTSLSPFFRVSIEYLNCVMASTPSDTSPLYIFAKYPAAAIYLHQQKGIIRMGPNSPIPCCGNIQYIWWQLHAGKRKSMTNMSNILYLPPSSQFFAKRSVL